MGFPFQNRRGILAAFLAVVIGGATPSAHPTLLELIPFENTLWIKKKLRDAFFKATDIKDFAGYQAQINECLSDFERDDSTRKQIFGEEKDKARLAVKRIRKSQDEQYLFFDFDTVPAVIESGGKYLNTNVVYVYSLASRKFLQKWHLTLKWERKGK